MEKSHRGCEVGNIKKSTKERSREHRKRKKQYLENLEIEVEQLKKRVLELEGENNNLKELIKENKDAIQPKKFDHPLKSSEDFRYNNVYKTAKKDPSELRYTMVEQTMDSISDTGENRVNYIKEKFKDIIDNIVSMEMKSFYAMMKDSPLKPTLRKLKTKKRHSKYYNKTYQNAGEILLECNLSDNIIDVLSENTNRAASYARKIKKIVKHLVGVRNRLLNLIGEERERVEKADMKCGLSYQKEDIAEFAYFFEKVKKCKFIDPNYLWDLPKRTSKSGTYEEFEMTEED